MSYIKLADTLVIPFSTCNSAGALTNADSTPVVVVRDNGSDLGYAPAVTNISAGRYEVAIVATGGNGFTAGHHYSVWVYTAMNSVSIGDGIGWFNVKTYDVDDRNADVTLWNSSAVATPNVAGVPKVDVVDWLGTAPDALSSGKLPADVKLWLTAAPASLTTSGFVKSTLLRWLTDDAAGTPVALSTTTKLVQTLVARWATDDASGTVITPAVAGVPKVDVVDWLGTAPDALSSGKLPADVKLWLTVAPDALSSGKVPADLKLWLTAAPASLTTNGYVKTALLRWLTDDAAGTPVALSATTKLVQSLVSRWATDDAAGTVATPAVNGVPKVDAVDWASQTIPTPTVAGVPNVNAKTWNDLATVSLPLVPTTAGRTLDVSATGEAGLDWANVGSPTTTLGLSGTTIKNSTDNATTEALIVAAVSNIAVTGAALNTIASSRTITTGSETNATSDTNTADGVFHNITDSAGTIDFYYEFDVSATSGAVAVGVQWLGYVVGLVNTIKVYARNFNGAVWDQLGTIVGTGGTVSVAEVFDLTSAHTQAGLARIRFSATGLTAATIKTDRILLGYAVVAPTVAAIQSGLATSAALATVQSDTDDIQTRLPAALVGGKMDSHVNDIAANAITASSIAANAITAAAIATDAIDADALKADAVTEIQTGLATSAALATVQSDTDDIQTRLPASLVGGKMDSHVNDIAANAITASSIAANAITAAAIATDAIDADALKADAVTEIQAGLATSAALATAQTAITDIQGDVDNIEAITATASALAAVAAQLPAALVGGRMDSSVGAYQSGKVPLQPTVAGNTLDVNVSGNAGIDWANIDAPTTTVNLSGTTVGVVTALASAAYTAIKDAVFGGDVETGLTLVHAMQAIFSEAAGKVSGFVANLPKFRNKADSKDRISGTTTSDGRTVVTFNFD